jgi:hypothetical protein
VCMCVCVYVCVCVCVYVYVYVCVYVYVNEYVCVCVCMIEGSNHLNLNISSVLSSMPRVLPTRQQRSLRRNTPTRRERCLNRERRKAVATGIARDKENAALPVLWVDIVQPVVPEACIQMQMRKAAADGITAAANVTHVHLHGLPLSSSPTSKTISTSSVSLLLIENKREAEAKTAAANAALVHMHSFPTSSSSSGDASLSSTFVPQSSLVVEPYQPVFKAFRQAKLLQPLSTYQSSSNTPSRWDEEEVHGWLADKPYRMFLEGTMWDNNESATRTPVMLSQVGEPWTKWDGGLLALAFSHPTTFLHFLGVNAVKFFCDMETLFASEVDGHGRDVLRARRDDREHAGGSMSTWTAIQVEKVLRDKQYKHKLQGLQWNGMHLYAALRFPGAFLEFMGADGVIFWRDLEMLVHGPPAEEAWSAGR